MAINITQTNEPAPVLNFINRTLWESVISGFWATSEQAQVTDCKQLTLSTGKAGSHRGSPGLLGVLFWAPPRRGPLWKVTLMRNAVGRLSQPLCGQRNSGSAARLLQDQDTSPRGSEHLGSLGILCSLPPSGLLLTSLSGSLLHPELPRTVAGKFRDICP